MEHLGEFITFSQPQAKPSSFDLTKFKLDNILKSKNLTKYDLHLLCHIRNTLFINYEISHFK